MFSNYLSDKVISFLHRFKTISITLKEVSTNDYMGYKDPLILAT
jgi:hypothetical protein